MLSTRLLSEQDTRLAQDLTAKLIREWEAPGEVGEPLIIQEAAALNEPPRHIYVVWSAWEQLSPLERSRIIMNAAEAIGSIDYSLHVTVAMGLTPQEAERIGITFR